MNKGRGFFTRKMVPCDYKAELAREGEDVVVIVAKDGRPPRKRTRGSERDELEI